MVWTGDEQLTALEKACIGKSSRLTLVLEADRHDLLFMADMLRGLATQLQFNAKREGLSHRDMLFTVKGQIELVNRAIRKHFAEKGIYVREGGHTLKEKAEQTRLGQGTLTPSEIRRYNVKYDVGS